MSWLLLATACTLSSYSDKLDPNGLDTEPAMETPDPESEDPTESDSDAESPTDAPPTDSEEPTDTEETELQTVRFVVLGDAGEGNEDQYAVSAAIEDVCAKRGCEFALYLGDNFYDDGVDGPDDEQFEEKFELPYANLTIPFHVVLGNHDYGGGGAGYEYWKADYQIEYSDSSSLWSLPDRYYTFTEEHVQFFALDTNMIMWGFGEDQQDWLDAELAASTADWTIAFGHHPFISNGQHGNAGEYEGIPYIPIVSGEDVEDFMDASLCGEVDLYFCGHDHNRQWLESTCGTEFIVSGAGAKVTDLQGRGNDTWFEDDSTEGFMWVEIAGEEMTGAFYDKDGNLDFTQTITR